LPVQPVLLLGNSQLYEISAAVTVTDLPALRPVVQDLHDTLMDFRARYGAGRAIAAPQIGVMKRLIYLHITEPLVLFNPQLTRLSPTMIEIWDDCMCFPDLLVRVRRHQACCLEFRDWDWTGRSMPLEGSLSELLQHECDHLDGILAVSRAIDGRSFALRSQLGRCRTAPG
jgi:peptide deformylase